MLSRTILNLDHRLLLRIVAILFISNSVNHVFAQTSTNCESKAKIFLSAETGLGHGKYLDKGVSPLLYKGLMLSQGFAFSIDINKMRFVANATAFGGLYGKSFKTDLVDNFSENEIINRYYSKCIDADFSITSIYQFNQSEKKNIRLYIGGSIEEYLDIKINDNYQNSSIGTGNFLNLNMDFIGEYDFSFFNNKRTLKRNSFTVSFRLSMPLASCIIRPGYSYLINANGNTINYIPNLRFLIGIDTETGLSFSLKNGNRIKANYYWTYITTGKTSIHRFDDAKHMFCISFHFKLN